MSIKQQTIRYGLFLLPTLLLAQTGTGLKGDYFNNTALTGVVALSKVDPNVNFEWLYAAPAVSLPNDNFSVRWTGQVEAPVTGAYTFATQSDDGVRLWVDGKLLVNNWSNHSSTRNQSSPVTLTAGRKYDIQLEYFEGVGNSIIKLRWAYPGQVDQAIPQNRLYPTPITLQAAPIVVSRAWLSELPFLSATNGWGPVERDKSNNDRAAGDGRTLTLDGNKYSRGLGVHAASEVVFALDDRYDTFKALVGVDDEVGTNGTVVFEVWVDGVRKFQSPTMRGNTPALAVEVNTENARQMKLVVTNAGDNINYDHADWADARFEGVEKIKYLSDLRWVSATNGRGEVQKDNPVISATGARVPDRFMLRGQAYRKGLGTFPAAEIKYNLDKKYERFSAVIGIDDTATGRGSVVYEVWSGTAMLFRSGTLRGISPVQQISLDVKNKTELTLKVTDAGDGTNMDLADWADAKLLPINSDAPVVPPPPPPPGTAPAAPTNLTATPGNALINLSWQSVTGAASYSLFRGTSANNQSTTAIATNLTATSFSNTGLTNGTAYFYKVRAVNSAGAGNPSNEATATPVAAPPPPPPPPPAPTVAPTNLTATPGNTTIALSWTAVTGATSYNVYRGTATNAQATTPVATNLTAPTFNNTGLTNGTRYFYKVTAVNAGGIGPASAEASATPLGAPVAPVLTSAAGDTRVTLNWTAIPGAATYNVYRGTATNTQANVAIATNVTGITYANTGLTNGTAYFYKITAVNVAGESPRSNESSATPTAAPAAIDPTTLSAFRLVRQTSFGPRPGEVDRVKTLSRTAYLDEQFAIPASQYPDSLFALSVEDVQEHFMRLALTGNDQLRQRVAFSLSKIWAVNAGEVNRSDATVTYYRIFMNRAFGNYRDLMTDVTLNPAMGRFLNMLNSKSESSTTVPAVENFPRELLQLFTLGSDLLNNGGVAQTGSPYGQADIKALARLFTGWTYGDGNPIQPTNSASENWRVPMEPVERFHDVTAKTFLGVDFAPNRTTRQDLDQALDVIFNHPTLPPFISKQLITQLVTSNPSAGYVESVTNAFINNGSNVRGDMRAVLRAIFAHPEANLGGNTSGKLMEPVLMLVSPLRTLNATVSDFPFMADLSAEMGQKVLFPPSVFSYFSPFFEIRNGALLAPEFQVLTTVTALIRTNYMARVLNADLSGSTTINYADFTSRAADAAALTDYVALRFMGGQISPEHRSAIISAVSVSPAADTTERVRTALYLVLTSAQYQVDR